MFPNPQSALPLAFRPSIERYKKIAKELIKACKSGRPGSVRTWAQEWVEAIVALSGVVITPELPVRVQRWVDEVEDFARRKLLGGGPDARTCALADAQFVIARSHGFESWPRFAQHLHALVRDGSTVSRFEAAADAIVGGDIETLERLLREEPALIRARSTREHGATLLHYVSANGIEGYRQRTPPNIVQVAAMLLRAGADVDATANAYGGGCTALALAATSIHPAHAGVLQALAGTLLEHGAHIGLPEAAALGRLDLVRAFFAEDGSLKASATREQFEQGFLYACRYGRTSVVEFLVEQGIDLTGHGDDGQTGLHWAVIGGQLDTVNALLKRKLPLETKNSYGSTAFGQALWSAAHDGEPDRYVVIIEALAAAGAKIPERHVSVNATVDEWLAKHGSQAEPTWFWYGEKPAPQQRRDG